MKKSHATRRIRILIADDHPVVREGLRALINRTAAMHVVDEAADGKETIQKFFECDPDVLLLDFYFPKITGLEITQAILKKAPDAKIIMLSTYNRDEDIYQAMRAGAKAYLLKDSPREELLDAIRAVHAGDLTVSPTVGALLAAEFTRKRLTSRETEIMNLMAAGKSNKEIGQRLQTSEGTVKVHVGHILQKLQATGRTDAIRIALERGIVRLETH